MLIGLGSNTPSPWSTGQKTQLHQIRLIHILQGDRLLINGGRESLQPHWTAPVILNNTPKHPVIDGVQSQMIDLQGSERLIGHFFGNNTPGLHLSEVPHPAQHPVGDPGSAPAAARNLHCPFRLNGHLQDTR